MAQGQSPCSLRSWIGHLLNLTTVSLMNLKVCKIQMTNYICQNWLSYWSCVQSAVMLSPYPTENSVRVGYPTGKKRDKAKTLRWGPNATYIPLTRVGDWLWGLATVAPKYNFSSPHHFFSSPHHFFSSPHHFFYFRTTFSLLRTTLHQLFSSPHQLFSSPHQLFSSPHQLFSSPHPWERIPGIRGAEKRTKGCGEEN